MTIKVRTQQGQTADSMELTFNQISLANKITASKDAPLCPRPEAKVSRW
jgi:hypothetical protein